MSMFHYIGSTETGFKSLFFDVEKRRQCSEVRAIPWDLL